MPHTSESTGMLVNLDHQIDSIADEDLAALVRECLADAPADWWKLASSTSGFRHPPDERGENGRLIHCLRLCSLADQAARWMKQAAGEKEVYWRDRWLAASIIHDLWWYIDKPNHAKRAAERVPNRYPILQAAIRTHMGPWGDAWAPGSAFGWLFHTADYWLSRCNVLTDWTSPEM